MHQFGVLYPTVYSPHVLCEAYRYCRDEAGAILAFTTQAKAELFARGLTAPCPRVDIIPEGIKRYRHREVVA